MDLSTDMQPFKKSLLLTPAREDPTKEEEDEFMETSRPITLDKRLNGNKQLLYLHSGVGSDGDSAQVVLLPGVPDS